MKNIHLIPTDKPSKLLYNHTLKSFCFQKEENGMFVNDGKVSGASFWSIEKAQHNGFCPQHIYITSDEEIKEGDWYFITESISKCESKYEANDLTDICKKIILTTDQDLIKDGVQAIDDEFLEWFVKNPSCEEVEVDKQKEILGEVAGTTYIDFNYKIIIPKEEAKQIKCYCGHTTYCDCSPLAELTQETLEEVAEIDLTRLCYYDRRNPDFQIKEEYGYDKEEVEATGNFAKKDCACDNCFYGRSKLTEQLLWQQERSYSEEDLRKAWEDGRNNVITVGKPPFVITKFQHNSFSNWFEQFKKK